MTGVVKVIGDIQTFASGSWRLAKYISPSGAMQYAFDVDVSIKRRRQKVM